MHRAGRVPSIQSQQRAINRQVRDFDAGVLGKALFEIAREDLRACDIAGLRERERSPKFQVPAAGEFEGCFVPWRSPGTRRWRAPSRQNVLFTLPAQVDYATEPAGDLSGPLRHHPDDAISGGSAVLEAMRLFKDYAWSYPVKFLVVSGEEVGLCGSTAYTRISATRADVGVCSTVTRPHSTATRTV